VCVCVCVCELQLDLKFCLSFNLLDSSVTAVKATLGFPSPADVFAVT